MKNGGLQIIIKIFEDLKTTKLVPKRKLVGLVILGGESHICVRKIILKRLVS